MIENDNIRFREEMKARLKKFVIDLIRFCQRLPHTQEANIFKNQLLRSGSSVYANYRAACRARSKAEFFSKLSIVVEEADETEMWLDLLIDSKISDTTEAKHLHQESLEILRIMASARKNTKF
ncbi:four helix bundle protein [Maribellus sp. YY47]|uniref:four helix bundle protein n=1 Tax=Maribellus sp. YY47 TaxID=2929486 RepID=UPI002001712F|nr:four helix bundle protein [Maribellus sp. YY47]MCK3684188.1 four helix bundle protein [Maribellus sp. YY47]